MISDLLKREYFLELCQKHEELENPYLDINDLKINKYFFIEKDKKSYFEVKYQFKLTSRIDNKIYKELNKTKIFFYHDLISTIRDQRLSKILN